MTPDDVVGVLHSQRGRLLQDALRGGGGLRQVRSAVTLSFRAAGGAGLSGCHGASMWRNDLVADTDEVAGCMARTRVDPR